MSGREPRSATMRQIADAAGVSVTTVSHTLSGKRPVSPPTAARVRRIIDELGYAPDSAARTLQSGRSRMLGLAVPDIANSYFGRLARGVEEAANEADHGVVICSTSNADPRREKRYFNMLRTRAIDGLIYNAGREVTETDELIRVARRWPVVITDEAVAALSGVPSVTVTNRDGGRQAGAHLRALGHERAVVLTGFTGLDSTVERTAGFRTHFPEALVLHGDYEQATGYALTSSLLANHVPFTCIFACNDLMAVGAMRRLREAGVDVPRDVSVVGFDDIDMAAAVSPGLTTVRQNTLEIGKEAARMMIAALTSGDVRAVGSVILPVELIVRDTTAPVVAATV